MDPPKGNRSLDVLAAFTAALSLLAMLCVGVLALMNTAVPMACASYDQNDDSDPPTNTCQVYKGSIGNIQFFMVGAAVFLFVTVVLGARNFFSSEQAWTWNSPVLWVQLMIALVSAVGVGVLENVMYNQCNRFGTKGVYTKDYADDVTTANTIVAILVPMLIISLMISNGVIRSRHAEAQAREKAQHEAEELQHRQQMERERLEEESSMHTPEPSTPTARRNDDEPRAKGGGARGSGIAERLRRLNERYQFSAGGADKPDGHDDRNWFWTIREEE